MRLKSIQQNKKCKTQINTNNRKAVYVMKYYVRKILTLIITLLCILLLTFTAFSVIPGDAAVSRLGMDATDEEIEQLREYYGLNDSIPVRFVKYVSGVVKGDFGISTQYSKPVSTLMAQRLPVTIWLAVISMLLIIVISVPVGLICAKKPGGVFDRIIIFINQIFMAVPAFFLGMIICIVFGVMLSWFVPGRYTAPSAGFIKFLGYMIFPAISIALPKIAMTVKFLRSSVLREYGLDYVRTAKSKGNSETGILVRHVLKNALIPVITFLGMILADILAGSIVAEQVFNLPGVGRLLVNAISNRDYPVVQASVIYIASLVLIINFIVDIMYKKLDPRVK